jgi:hypothetical protein
MVVAQRQHALFACNLERAMKKLLLTCGVVALLAGAGTAQAQSAADPTGVAPDTNFTTPVDTGPTGVTFLYATAVLDKDVNTQELINITTLVDLDQTVDDTTATGFAESTAMAKQTNTDNHDCGNCAEKTDTINGSGNNNTGLVSINQAAGNMNNQGTLVSAAIDSKTFNPPPPPPGVPPTPVTPSGEPVDPGFAHSQAEATQINGFVLGGVGGIITTPGNDVEAVGLLFRDADITNSLNHDIGLVYANQSSGNNNNQLNELSLAFSERPQGVAIAEADLGQFNIQNKVGESDALINGEGDGIGINKHATISGSLTDDVGIFGVNQTVGNNGNQANIVSIAAIGTNLPSF